MRRLLTLALALLAPLGVAAAECVTADGEALKWLDRMSHSLRETSYRGVFTYQQGGGVQTMRIVHSVRDDVETEQLTRLSGASATVLRVEHPLDCIHPGHRLVRIGELYRGAGDDCGVAAFYRLQMAGDRRIAGRDAVLMNVLPRDMYRYGYRLALDRETGLLLKTETVSGDGQVLERFQFADVEIGDVDVRGTQVEVVHRAAHRHGGERRPAPPGRPPWTVGWLPEGFMMTDKVDGTGYDKTFTDGLATFTVFLEALPSLEKAEEVTRILGEVPVNTARRVVDSVNWVSAPVR